MLKRERTGKQQLCTCNTPATACSGSPREQHPLYTQFTPIEKKQSSPSSPILPPHLLPHRLGTRHGEEGELEEDALLSNPVCRFTSSLIRSNRSQLSYALGQGARFERDINLAGSKAGCQGKHLSLWCN